MMKKLSVLLLFSLMFSSLAAQDLINGRVVDADGKPIFAANVFCGNNVVDGAVTDFDGKFSMKQSCDTLCFSFIGFQQYCSSIGELAQNDFLVSLMAEEHFLSEALIKATDPISNKFSVVKLDKIDIYQTPVSAGDPLKAITALPSSTNSDESANPVLRGSSSDRSRVVINGVPIRNPVRNGQLNGLGNFSLLNAEIIDKLYVYASNPPLTYGETTAGLVEVETKKELDGSEVQLSTSMANLGLFVSQELKNNNFFQIYSNYQFSDAFLKLNEANLPGLKDFGSTDVGLNFKLNIGKKAYWNSYSYFIDESFQTTSNFFTYEGLTDAKKKRFFTINNFNLKLKSGLLRVNNLIDASEQDFSFGNIKTNLVNAQVYTSIDYKRIWDNGMIFQGGANLSNWNYDMSNQFSRYYYAIAPSAPVVFQDTLLQNRTLENYAYFNWDINQQITLSTGIRVNIPLTQDPFYQSAQLSLKYEPNKRNRFLLSAGKYHNYSTPNFSSQAFNLLNSFQIALDYDLKVNDFQLLSAIYYKSEAGDLFLNSQIPYDQSKIFGLELFVNKKFFNYFNLTLSNSFLNQTLIIEEEEFRGVGDFNYFGKLSFQYNNPAILTAAISYVNRPGEYYTPIVGADYNSPIDFVIPIFDNTLNGAQYNTYSNLSFSCSRYFPMGKNAFIAFLSISNLLNEKNERTDLYTENYADRFYDYYQQRTLYFGLVFQFYQDFDKR